MRVVDSLELIEDEVAVRAGHKDAVAAGRLEPVIVAHGETRDLMGDARGIVLNDG